MVGEAVNTLLVVLLVGSLTLLGFIHISNPWKINQKGNYYFGIFLLFWASFWVDEMVDITANHLLSQDLSTIIRSIQILITPLLYFTIIFYSNPFYKYKFKDLIHLVLPLLYTVALSIQLQNNGSTSWLNYFIIGIISFQALFYTTLSYIKIRNHKKKIQKFTSNNQGRDLVWLEYIIIQIFITSIVVVVVNLFFDSDKPGILVNGINVAAIYLISYFSLRQKEIFPIKEGREKELEYLNKDENESEPTKRKLIPDKELAFAKNQLEVIMQKEKPHLDSDLNLVKLADMLEITPHQLSYTINNGFNQNFFQFVNQHRVEKAKELLKDQSHDYTILAIAFESGFNSKTSFNTTFKKLTGQTPTEFKKTAI
ncbi:helix-turn-helix domain-containing protein [Carboxylicivirga linearis]|uniref:AraC family transcriptional regulator n=1 Tax=Carboxylicivirga linearis TaxID=1628157 RepID=A0ABS5JU10_9BACT|nr:helix-turn-helix domain-containing protein [Carboxylicivirga linearis]MBS2098285.1 AraC family transcriptional regulator [Carboxylicivirga linearis]